MLPSASLASGVYCVVKKAEALATRTLGGIDPADVEEERFDRTADRLSAIRQSHPEADLAFVVIHCSLLVENYPVFGTAQSRKRTPKETSHTS